MPQRLLGARATRSCNTTLSILLEQLPTNQRRQPAAGVAAAENEATAIFLEDAWGTPQHPRPHILGQPALAPNQHILSK